MAGHVACMEGLVKLYKILFLSPERQKSLERLLRGWEDNVKMNNTVCGYGLTSFSLGQTRMAISCAVHAVGLHKMRSS